MSVALLIALVLMFVYPLRHDKGIFWSPYYQVTTFARDRLAGRTGLGGRGQRHPAPAADQRGHPGEGGALVQPAVPARAQAAAERADRRSGHGHRRRDRLAHGAKHVDAVEIDPTLLRFGRQHNPDHVYQDPRVTAHINDGRAYLQSTHKKFDLILFALPDSLTLVSGASSLRLESYLFTIEAVRRARSHLAPGGAFAMYNFYREAWLVDRSRAPLDKAFGHPPCLSERRRCARTAPSSSPGSRPADQKCERDLAAHRRHARARDGRQAVPVPRTLDGAVAVRPARSR